MTLAVTFHPAAKVEFVEAAARYEGLSPTLGLAFIAEIERCVVSAASQPLIYASVRANTRRVTARRFPYSVYFQPEHHRIVILAVFHGRRHPRIWKRRT